MKIEKIMIEEVEAVTATTGVEGVDTAGWFQQAATCWHSATREIERT